MSLTALKSAIRTLLLTVPDVGTIDLARIDPDSVPRKLRGGTYWGLALSGLSDREAGLGGASSRPLFRTYTLRLEGWRGISGSSEATEEWETLVETLCNTLELGNATVAQSPGVTGFQRFGRVSAAVDVVTLGGTSSRAHHAVITADVEVYRLLTG